jgi:hypothetical protein
MKWLIAQAIQAGPKVYIAFTGIHYCNACVRGMGVALFAAALIAAATIPYRCRPMPIRQSRALEGEKLNSDCEEQSDESISCFGVVPRLSAVVERQHYDAD